MYDRIPETPSKLVASGVVFLQKSSQKIWENNMSESFFEIFFLKL